mgnify:CR=1 FL=1
MCIRDRAKIDPAAPEATTEATFERILWYNVFSTNDGKVQLGGNPFDNNATQYAGSVSYTHLRAHETVLDLVCRLLLEKKK